MTLSGRVACLLLLALGAACGGRPPPPARGVIESDVRAWEFRRYQQVLDIEVLVPDSDAIAYTASYAHKDAVKRGQVSETDITHVFVTRYDRDQGIVRALARFSRRLAQEAGYVVEERKLSGVRVIEVSGHGEIWVLWAAPTHIVKVGGRGRDSVPGDLVAAYADRYPSRVQPGMLEGPLPPGNDPTPDRDGSDPEDEDIGGPRPDWDQYDPDDVKTPESR